MEQRATFANRVDSGPRTLITEVARAVPKRSIIVTTWVDATALAYASYVEKTLDGRIIIAGWSREYELDYATWAKSYNVYLLGNQAPDFPEVVFKDAGVLDGSHHLWRVTKGLRCWRDPHTNRMFGPDAFAAALQLQKCTGQNSTTSVQMRTPIEKSQRRNTPLGKVQ